MSADPAQSVDPLHALIRQHIGDGILPCVHVERVYAGDGRGERCDGCHEPIAEGDVLYEVRPNGGGEITRLLCFHIECYRAWQEECGRRRQSEQTL